MYKRSIDGEWIVYYLLYPIPSMWYISVHLPFKSTSHVGKYTNPMDGMGMLPSWYFHSNFSGQGPSDNPWGNDPILLLTTRLFESFCFI